MNSNIVSKKDKSTVAPIGPIVTTSATINETTLNINNVSDSENNSDSDSDNEYYDDIDTKIKSKKRF